MSNAKQAALEGKYSSGSTLAYVSTRNTQVDGGCGVCTYLTVLDSLVPCAFYYQVEDENKKKKINDAAGKTADVIYHHWQKDKELPDGTVIFPQSMGHIFNQFHSSTLMRRKNNRMPRLYRMTIA